MLTKTGKTILNSHVRNQIFHVLGDAVEKSTTLRITKRFACVDQAIPIHTKFSLGHSILPHLCALDCRPTNTACEKADEEFLMHV